MMNHAAKSRTTKAIRYMKRIAPGKVVTREIWWKGYKGRCDQCGEQIELEGDETIGDTLVADNQAAQVACPNECCDGLITILREQERSTCFIWNMSAEPGVDSHTHKLSLVDAIETASSVLETDYTSETETIVTGHAGRIILVTLRKFNSEPLTKEGFAPNAAGVAVLGKLGNRVVVYDKTMVEDAIIVSNDKTKKQVVIKMECHPGKPPFAVKANEHALKPRLFDELALVDTLFKV